MTQDQRDLIMRELSDFKSRKVFKTPDNVLEYAEKQCIPYEKVLEMHKVCKEIGTTKAGKMYNKSRGKLLKLFAKYNLPIVGRSYSLYDGKQIERTVTPELVTQRHQDSLTMGYGAWNEKYGIKSRSLYYKYRNYAKKYFEELAQVESK